MPHQARPPGFEGSRDPTPEDLDALPAITQDAMHVLERCMVEHHIAEVDYTEPDEHQVTIRIRPAFIRYSRAHNLVAWGFPVGADHWIELRLDRIRDVRDTGDVFEPTGNGHVLSGPQRRGTLATGQVMEFLVWANLIEQSYGALHIFLPLLDRGLDAVIHRRTDGRYFPVQVKCRTEATNGFVEIGIPASELVDDDALIIAGLLTDGEIGPRLLVVEEGTFKDFASRSPVSGEDVYSASFSMTSSKSRWRPYLVPHQQLAERLMGPQPLIPWLEPLDELEAEPIDRYARWLGFLGEAEVVRRLAENPSLDLFRPFPDLEMVEVLTCNRITHCYCGLQIKTGVPTAAHDGEARIPIRKATLVPAPNTYIVALAWIAEQRQFADEFLLIPTTELVGVAVEGGVHLFLNFHPHSQERTRLDPYRRPLSDLGQLVADSSAS